MHSALLDIASVLRLIVSVGHLPLGMRDAVVEVTGGIRGPWTFEGRIPPFGYAVIEGFLARTITVAGGHCVELFGPGDIIGRHHVRGFEAVDMAVRFVSWKAVDDVLVGRLDERLPEWEASLPELRPAIADRKDRQSDATAAQHAIARAGEVPERVHLMLWELAVRYGHVRRTGVHLPVKLPHKLLGQMIAASRQTVCTACGELKDAGLLVEEAAGWTLPGRPPGSGEIVTPTIAGPVVGVA